MSILSGRLIRGEVSSSNASSGVAFSLFDPAAGAAGTSFTLGATQRLVIHDFDAFIVATGRYVLAADADTAGKRLLHGTVAANTQVSKNWARPIELPVGVVPKLFAASGQADATIVCEVSTTR